MKVRNFEELRKDILPYVREIRVGGGRKFVESMFSKKFWSTFLNKDENADMKELWESLPFLNGKVSQKKKLATQKVKNSVTSSPQASETETITDKTKPEEDLLTEVSAFPEEIGKGFLFEDEKFDIKDVQIQDFLNQFDDKELNYPMDRFLFDEEDTQMQTEDKAQGSFFENFWSAWNHRSFINHSDNNNDDFSMIGKHVQLPESEESAQRIEWVSFDDNAVNADFFGLSQDSYKQASFSAWK